MEILIKNWRESLYLLLVSQPEAFALPCTSKTSNAEAHADMYKDTPRYRAYVLTRERNSCGIYHYIHTPGIYNCLNPDLYMEFAKFPIVKIKRM